MQIIQSPLGNNIHPLGVISSLSTSDRMILKKKSHSLHSRSNFLSPIQTKLPLVTSSKFFLSREHEPSIQPLIGWDSWDNQDINSDLPLLESDFFDSIALPENSHVNTSEIVKDSIPEILPNRIDKKTSDDTSQQLNIKSKSKSKKINKSQKPLEKKSKSKSKKAVKSSVAKNSVQSDVNINSHENSLLTSDEPLSVEANLEIPTLQLDNAVVDNSLVLPSALTSPDLDDAPTLTHPLANDENTVGAHIAVPNSESSVAKSFIAIQQEIDSNVSSESPASIPVQLTPTSADIEDAPSLFRNSDNNEGLVISESQSAMVVNVSDISANLTSLQRDNYLESTNSEFTESQPILVPPEIVETPIITPTSSEIGETAIAPLTAISPEIGEIPTISAISPEIGETAIAPLTATSSEIGEIPTISTISPEIGETAIAPLLATSPEIGETPIITATSPEIGKTAIAPLFATSIVETPIITPTSSEIGETAIAPLFATSSEIVEIPTISTISPEIVETAIAPLTATSSEIVEIPTISTISPEIGETAIAPLTATSSEIVEIPTISTISPENFETAIAPLTATSSEISEIPIITPTSPEISETAIAPLTAISPEISETPIITATSSEIGETASILREIIDNEQIVESEFPCAVTKEEHPEISTFVDTSDNLTSAQNEVNTLPQVEQNAIAENLPAPKGYATGGHVIDSHVENRQQIAPSDTVPAMLTPGEFVINTRDAQKNLPLLHHINTGGIPHDIILPSLQTPNPQEPEEETSPETPTKVDSFSHTSLQLKSAETDSPEISNSLLPSSLGLNISKQKLSILNSPEIHTLHNETIDVGESSPQYSSPPMIFRKANSTTKTSSQWSNTPSQWSSVEDLLNGNDDEFTSFDFNDGESNSQNYEFSHVSESPQVFAKHLLSARGFANGGEVTPPDISREIAPVTETIESASSFSQEDDKDDTADLEALAREVYSRLRQRIEIERERHGGSSGRLPW
ncbi:hypothetical protein CDG76_21580 [Nostoc sp. 'Peltigera membranacea cyanobiont' 210A]|uniref:hypothetical protein n=1 Tax=Nostoc sp. 'Peltigera membranacea cyanobiont' 210A TaxID=2014529 RepID=UPI000B959CC5|nr:hypothetical protein [Nostoc sp. 'Peltigera membranacea cyanobiont' 210A]OYD93267.1 hypothetical protein CDG76_21580 [Nostoc sp. 'Peltigera membranacea cyanobiont' 210A]